MELRKQSQALQTRQISKLQASASVNKSIEQMILLDIKEIIFTKPFAAWKSNGWAKQAQNINRNVTNILHLEAVESKQKMQAFYNSQQIRELQM